MTSPNEPPSRAARAYDALGEWFLRARALRAARAASGRLPPEQRRWAAAARHAAEAGDRLLDPDEPLAGGDGAHLALSLYREAAHWALLALVPPGNDGARPGADLATLFDLVDGALLARLAGGEWALASARAALAERTFADALALEPGPRRREASAARALVYALCDRADGDVDALARVRRERAARVALGALLGAALAVGGATVARKNALGPNLAAGKPWRASSVWAPCNPAQHLCGAVRTDAFFHTQEDDSPWLEIDLGGPTQVGRVEIVNRSDCCAERASPLVVELSDDGTSWQGVARNDAIFDSWVARFPRRAARFVRVRVDRRSYLHLASVKVRG